MYWDGFAAPAPAPAPAIAIDRHAQEQAELEAARAQELHETNRAIASANAQMREIQETMSRLQVHQQQQQQQQHYQQPPVSPTGFSMNLGVPMMREKSSSGSSSRSTKSRSSSRQSRRPGGSGHDRARSASAEKMIFVRKPHDRSGTLYVTTREALRNEKSGGD